MQSEKEIPAKSSIGLQIGPAMLLGSFAVLLLQSASEYWSIAIVAMLGYIASLYFKKWGLYFSLVFLALNVVFLSFHVKHVFWLSLLASSVAMSWTLLFFGNEESLKAEALRNEETSLLEESKRILERELKEAKLSLSKESKELLLDKQRAQEELAQILSALQQSQSTRAQLEKEKDHLEEKYSALSQDVFAAQRKEVAFQHALEDAQNQVIILKNQLALLLEAKLKPVDSNIVKMQDSDPQEQNLLKQAQAQYLNLREQFEEKSEALDQTRKQLFKTENELLALQKLWEEKALENSEENEELIRSLKRLEEERQTLESQVNILEEFVSSLISPKKRSAKPKKKTDKQEKLPLLIQEKLDQISVDSFETRVS